METLWDPRHIAFDVCNERMMLKRLIIIIIIIIIRSLVAGVPAF